jgi:hypothetical protein
MDGGDWPAQLVTAFSAKDKKPEIEAVGRYLFEHSRVHATRSFPSTRKYDCNAGVKS